MMCFLSKDQQQIYKQYSRLTSEILPCHSNEDGWSLISSEGIWRMVIPKDYGGDGLGWQECFAAFDGFLVNYTDHRIFDLFISHISALYLILQYGSEEIKKLYLPRLMKGDVGCLIISENVQLINCDLKLYKNIKNNISKKNNMVIIYIEKIRNEIVIFFKENMPYEISGINNAVRFSAAHKNKFILTDDGLSVLYDLILFKKLFYGVFLSNYCLKRNNKNK